MEMFHLEPLHISTRGLRFGALADPKWSGEPC
jgi:hypothetical protein